VGILACCSAVDAATSPGKPKNGQNGLSDWYRFCPKEPRMPPKIPAVRVLRAQNRFVTRGQGIVSRHCFSFGRHYDPGNTSFGPLLACNDEALAIGAGFPSHPHAGTVIVTWIVQGRLEHADSAGRIAVSGPGVVQILTTGGGLRHQELNAGNEVCRFVQSWLAAPDDAGPGRYEQVDVSAELSAAAVVPLLELDDADARLHAGRLPPCSPAELPAGPLVHVFVVRGSLTVEGAAVLEQGDSARLTDAGPLGAVTGALGAELLVWEMTGTPGS
jgi:redox-sensitive bicupin YhaK (pirin superfamily)